MKSLFEKNTLQEIIQRLDKLMPNAERKWGKMDAAQMMAHCSVALKVATGQNFPPRLFIGRMLGSFLKSKYYDKNPFRKNSPTDKTFIIADKRDFEQEKITLIHLTQQFTDGGSQKCTTHPHSFFGKLTPEQWSIGMYKHLDHHLRQFGV